MTGRLSHHAAVVLLIAALVASCGTSDDSIRPGLLAGPWLYTAHNAAGSSAQYELTFRDDGTFSGVVATTTQPLPTNGHSTWQTDGTTLTLCFTDCDAGGLTAAIDPSGSFSADTVDSSGVPTSWSLSSADTPRAAAGPASSDTPAPAAGDDADSPFRGSVDAHDKDGYTYRIDYTSGRFDDPVISITGDKPGEASATVSVHSTLAITGTTPGRTAPSVEHLQIHGLYRSDRAACRLLTAESNSAFDDAANGVRELPSGDYCSATLAELGIRTETTTSLEFTHREENGLRADLPDLVRGPDTFMVIHTDPYRRELRSPGACAMPEQDTLFPQPPSTVLVAAPAPPADCAPL